MSGPEESMALRDRRITGAELRALREAAGLTQDEIAARVGWTDGSVTSGYEGRAEVTDKAAARYLKALVEEMVSRGSG